MLVNTRTVAPSPPQWALIPITDDLMMFTSAENILSKNKNDKKNSKQISHLLLRLEKNFDINDSDFLF